MELQNEIKVVTNLAIQNQAQRDMMKKFGIFVTYFLFMLPKYDRWYSNRIRQIKSKLRKRKGEEDGK